MSIENVHGYSPCSTSTLDPRTRILREHYFSLRPAPLEEWLWAQQLPASAERVFWLHWQEGQRRGDFCSEIPLRVVARRCHLNVSSITRAYQKLEGLGCLKRTDPGRNPANPFCQATAVTEVFIPKVLLTTLSRYPRRGQRASPAQSRELSPPAANPTAQSHQPTTQAEFANGPSPTRLPLMSAPSVDERTPSLPSSAPPERSAPSAAPAAKDPLAGLSGRQRLGTLNAWRSDMSEAERRNFDTAFRETRPSMTFDPDCRLSDLARTQILELLRYMADRPPSGTQVPSLAQPARSATRRPTGLGISRSAILRGKLVALRGVNAGDELLRQITWSIERGALTKFPVPKAMAIALKKVREDTWTRPHRMPANSFSTQRNPSSAGTQH